jgi:hypothetical protein
MQAKEEDLHERVEDLRGRELVLEAPHDLFWGISDFQKVVKVKNAPFFKKEL